MSRRCEHHNFPEPCIYCARNFPPFNGWRDRLEALETLFMTLEGMAELAAKPPELLSHNPDLPLRDFDTRQAIAVVRDVGIGDIVMLSHSIKALKKKNPDRPIVFVTKPENFEVLAGASYLDAMMPINAFDPRRFHQAFDLCLAVETQQNGGKLTMEEYFSKTRPDVFAEILGVMDVPRPFALEPHEGAMSVMRGYLKSVKHPIIGLAPTCRSPLRVMPPEYVEPLVERLAGYGGTVVLIGKTESWNRPLAQIRMKGLTNFIDRLSIKDMIATISLLDAMIVPNTGTLHVAGALGVKTLALEGNNDPKTFVNVYPSAKALQPSKEELPCIPCGDQRRTCGLKQKQFGADCMQLLTPDRIYREFRRFYNGRNIAFVRDISMDHVGGAEITDKGIVKLGMDQGYNVRLFDNSMSAEQLYLLFDYDLIIVSNCWLFEKPKLDIVMKAIRKVPYIKLEHDHRSLEPMPGGKFPKEEYADILFRNSVFNVFVSPAHREDHNRVGMARESICVFPPMNLDLYRPVPGIERAQNEALLGVPRKANLKEHNVRGNADLNAFRKENHHIRVNYMSKIVPPDKMPEVYSAYEYFVHLPIVKWSCERVIFEAALCGCKVVTNNNAEGVSWGLDLNDPDALRVWLKKNQGKFWQEVDSRIFKKETADEVSGNRGDSLRRVPPGPVALEQRA